MKLHRSPTPHPALLYMVPAFNLFLVLFFFLLPSSAFLLQPGISVSVPKSPFLLSPQRNPRIISITGPPVTAVFFENKRTSLTRLREDLKTLHGRTQTIIIKADQHVPYEVVTSVINLVLEMGFPVVLATEEGETTP